MISGRSGRRDLVALLLVTSIFFCHGLFGASHALATGAASHPGTMPAAQDRGTHHHPPEHAAAEPTASATASATDDGSATALHAGSKGGYFAVLLVLALAAILGFVRAFALAPARHEGFRGSPSRPLSGVGALLPRGPTPPLLQVFRL